MIIKKINIFLFIFTTIYSQAVKENKDLEKPLVPIDKKDTSIEQLSKNPLYGLNGFYPWGGNLWITTKHTIIPNKTSIQDYNGNTITQNIIHYIPHPDPKIDLALVLTDDVIPHSIISQFCFPNKNKDRYISDWVAISRKSTPNSENKQETDYTYTFFSKIHKTENKKIYFQLGFREQLNSCLYRLTNKLINKNKEATTSVKEIDNPSKIRHYEGTIVLLSYINELLSQEYLDKATISQCIESIDVSLVKEAQSSFDLSVFDPIINLNQKRKKLLIQQIEQTILLLKESLIKLKSQEIVQDDIQIKQLCQEYFDSNNISIDVPKTSDVGEGIFALLPTKNKLHLKYQLGLIGIIDKDGTAINLRDKKISKWITYEANTHQDFMGHSLNTIASKHAVMVSPKFIITDQSPFFFTHLENSLSPLEEISTQLETLIKQNKVFSIGKQKIALKGVLPLGDLILYELSESLDYKKIRKYKHNNEEIVYYPLNKDSSFNQYLHDNIHINKSSENKVSVCKKKASFLHKKNYSYNKNSTSFLLTVDPTTPLPQYKIYQIGDVIITEELAQYIEETISKIDSGELKTISLYDPFDEEISEDLSGFIYIKDELKPYGTVGKPMISHVVSGINYLLNKRFFIFP